MPTALKVLATTWVVWNRATQWNITFCSENIFPIDFFLCISKLMLLTNKRILLLNIQFRSSDETVHEDCNNQVLNTYTLANHNTARSPISRWRGFQARSVGSPNRPLTSKFGEHAIALALKVWKVRIHVVTTSGFGHTHIISDQTETVEDYPNDTQITIPADLTH